MRTKIACELATGHGGDLATALAMIDAAASAGADAVKIQHYGAVNPKDPQAAWLEQSRLSVAQIERLMARAKSRGLEFWATPFDAVSLQELPKTIDRFKIASTEANHDWWRYWAQTNRTVVSWPWGIKVQLANLTITHLTAIPLYPAPLEAASRVELLDGWSDHCVGIAACLVAIARNAQWLEVHLTLGEGKSRVMAWDKTPDQVRQLRQFAEDVETMRSGVGQVYRERWTA